MIISYLNEHLDSEPIHYLANLYNIKYIKSISSDNIIKLQLNDEDGKDIEIKDFFNVWDYLIKAYSRPNQNVYLDHNDYTYNLIRTIYKELSKYLKKEKEDDHSVIEIIKMQLKEILDIIVKCKILGDDINNPMNILLYEIILIINDTKLFELDIRFMNFVYMMESQPFMKEYIYTDEYINKNIIPGKMSIFNNRKHIILDNMDKLWDFAVLSGCLYSYSRKDHYGNDVIVADHIPFSCIPAKISLDDFKELYSIQKSWNELINSLSRDFDWYSQCLIEVFKADDFVENLYKIALKCKEYPHCQDIRLGIFRNDYMYHAEEDRWLQVEYNTIASGLPCISDRIQNFHKSLIKHYFSHEEVTPLTIKNEEMIIGALSEAFRIYGNPKAKVLMVVSKFEGNIFDQRCIEFGLLENDIHLIRMDLESIHKKAKLNQENGKLYINNTEIALVYYRAGYAPDHYPTEKEWKAREILELSNAIKCPNVDIQLIGFKKFQYYLCDEKNLKRFVKNADQRQSIMKNFAKFWNFDDALALPKIRNIVNNNPDGFVLKPQREGGGNNIYGMNILDIFDRKSNEELKSYILMEKINPSPYMGFLMKNRKLEIAPVINELGIFGYAISDKDKIIKNGVGGYLLRTKKLSSDEGGIAAGNGVIDSLVIQQKNRLN